MFLCIVKYAPLAQRIEHLASDQRVGGSNPSGRIYSSLNRSTHPNQQSEIILHFAFDFLNGYKKDKINQTIEHRTIYPDSSILREIEHRYENSETINFQIYLSSDTYINRFFLRIQSRLYFEFSSLSDSSYSYWSKYENDSFKFLGTSTEPLAYRLNYGFYPGFLIGIGYKWKTFKFLIYNANIVYLGISEDYTFDLIRRKPKPT